MLVLVLDRSDFEYEHEHRLTEHEHEHEFDAMDTGDQRVVPKTPLANRLNQSAMFETSPPDRVPSARHTSRAIELLTKRTEPSSNNALTLPEW